MFFLEMGDGPWALLAEIALSVAVILAVMFIVRLTNAGAGNPPSGHGSLPEPRQVVPDRLDQNATPPGPSETREQVDVAKVPR